MTEQETADYINALTPMQYKTLENRLRRMASRQGLTICKSKVRDPRAMTWGKYHIARGDTIVAGSGFDMSIDQVEEYLTGKPFTRASKNG